MAGRHYRWPARALVYVPFEIFRERIKQRYAFVNPKVVEESPAMG
jgi:hypothetical protein